jgi:hypothetical protein
MRNTLPEQKIFDPAADPEATFTAATTNIITSAAHGMTQGDCIQVSTTTTLPGGLSASTNYYVISVTTDTFKVSATPGGAEVDITNAGTGTHTYRLKGKVIYVADYRHSVIHLTFSSTPTMTAKIQGSISESAPDFNAAQSTTNLWDYIESIDLEDGSAIDGDTGLACTGTADNRTLEINVNGLCWVTVNITSTTAAGNLGVSIKAYND